LGGQRFSGERRLKQSPRSGILPGLVSWGNVVQLSYRFPRFWASEATLKKKIGLGLLLLTGALSVFFIVGNEAESEQPRSPASIPENYESLKAQEKQDILWDEVRATAYKELPEYKKFGVMQLISMSRQEIATKESLHSDFAPKGWKKYLHRRGAIAKVKIVPRDGQKYTGIFQGADSAFLRLSLTYKVTGSRPVAPGLALKVLRDGTYSANISALVSLNGQEKDHNFFQHPMSNIVPIGDGLGQSLVHKIFRKVSKYPEELVASDMAAINSQGEKIKDVVAPRQLFFIPSQGLTFAHDEHDVREDFMNIPEGTTVYQIHVAPEKYKDYDYSKYTPEDVAAFVKESHHVADIVTTSEFIASAFGDDGMFFRHQLRP